MSLKFSTKLYSAPIAGYTNDYLTYYFHLGGADYIYSEMFNVNEIIRFKDKLEKIFKRKDYKYIIQIFGKYGDPFDVASNLVQEYCDGIDINSGCPVKKVIKAQGGAFLLKDPFKMYKIVKSVKDSVDIPVSIKIRLGFDKIEIFEILSSLFEAKPNFITIHFRTAKMLFSGKANYDIAYEIEDKFNEQAKKLNIKLIYNGDIDSPQKAYEIIKNHNPYGLMIGREALYDPFIFHRIKYYFYSNFYDIEQYKSLNNLKKIPIFWFKDKNFQNLAILIGLYNKLKNEKFYFYENEKNFKIEEENINIKYSNIVHFRKIAHKLLKNVYDSKEIKNFINKSLDIEKILFLLIQKRKSYIK